MRVKPERILVVDDDPAMLGLLGVNLEARGYRPLLADRPEVALTQLGSSAPDLVILDLVLPGVSGMDIVVAIRTGSQVPIVMLSGRTDAGIKREALDLGADDYVTKPFDVGELLARVRALLRRAASRAAFPEGKESYVLGDLKVDLGRSEITRCGMSVKLSAQEWAVMRAFVRHAGRILSSRSLLQQAWGPEYGDEGDYVRTYVTRLRRKLEPDPSRPRVIVTERGLGYRLAPSERVAHGAGASLPHYLPVR